MNNTPEIVYEDNDILLIDKPPGFIVNKADTTKNVFTVQDWIEKKVKIKSLKLKVENSDFYNRSGIVHRLDKETSGLLIIAKNEEAFKNLQLQFKEGRVEKTYTALVYGKLIPKSGSIIAPIGRLPWNRMQFGVLPGGREAQTDYKVLDYYKRQSSPDFLSLIEAYPKTGRTHQIRVHLKYYGFPVVADPLYAGKFGRRDRKILPRHFLHASNLSFFHPKTAKKLTFSSHLPADLEKILKQQKKVQL